MALNISNTRILKQKTLGFGRRRQDYFGDSTPASGGFKRSVTLDQPSSDLTNFPVLILGTYSYLKTVANGGLVESASGYDIVFYSDSALTTKLDFERVSWDATTGAVEFWVRIPTLTSASPTAIYLGYGNAAIVTDQQNKNGTWSSDYVAVWHMDDASNPATDSTSNALSMTQTGTVTFGATGKIKYGTGYANNIANFLSNSSATLGLINALSISAWISSPVVGVGLNSNLGILDKTIGGATNKQYQLFLALDTPNFRLTKGGVSTTLTADAPLAVQNAWYHIMATWDGTTMKMYVNGVVQTTTPALAAPIDNGVGATVIGQIGSSVFAFDGTIDETRVLNTARTANWIAAEYSNQNDPANFYVIGSETPV